MDVWVEAIFRTRQLSCFYRHRENLGHTSDLYKRHHDRAGLRLAMDTIAESLGLEGNTRAGARETDPRPKRH